MKKTNKRRQEGCMVIDDFENVKGYMKILQDSGKIRVVYENFNSLYGMVYKGRNEQYLIIINSSLCIEMQKRIYWHESKHIYSHILHEGDCITFEKEAIEFSDYAITIGDNIVEL
jgi:hypothetical protein